MSDSVMEENSTAQYVPVVKLSEVAVDSGEKDEAEIFKARTALYRFDTNEWKERGRGDIRFLQHRKNSKIRVVLREDKTLKLRMNHQVNPAYDLNVNGGNATSWTWRAQDFATESLTQETFAVRFKTKEIAQAFKSVWDQSRKVNGGESVVLDIPQIAAEEKSDKGMVSPTPAASLTAADPVLSAALKEAQEEEEEEDGKPAESHANESAGEPFKFDFNLPPAGESTLQWEFKWDAPAAAKPKADKGKSKKKQEEEEEEEEAVDEEEAEEEEEEHQPKSKSKSKSKHAEDEEDAEGDEEVEEGDEEEDLEGDEEGDEEGDIEIDLAELAAGGGDSASLLKKIAAHMAKYKKKGGAGDDEEVEGDEQDEEEEGDEEGDAEGDEEEQPEDEEQEEGDEEADEQDEDEEDPEDEDEEEDEGDEDEYGRQKRQDAPKKRRPAGPSTKSPVVASASSSAGAAPSWAARLATGAGTGKWECPTCEVVNKDADKKCAACGHKRDGGAAEDSAPAFKFDAAGGFSLGADVSGSAPASSGDFTFGAPLDFKFSPFAPAFGGSASESSTSSSSGVSALSSTTGNAELEALKKQMAETEQKKNQLGQELEALRAQMEEDGWVNVPLHSVPAHSQESDGKAAHAELQSKTKELEAAARAQREQHADDLRKAEARARQAEDTLAALQNELKSTKRDLEAARKAAAEAASAAASTSSSVASSSATPNKDLQGKVQRLEEEKETLVQELKRASTSKKSSSGGGLFLSYPLLALMAAVVVGALVWPILGK